MAFDLSDCQFTGPALPAAFIKFELEKELNKIKTLPKTTGDEGKLLRNNWEVYRRKLRMLAGSGGNLRVRNHVIDSILTQLGYQSIEKADDVQTREDLEAGGFIISGDGGDLKLRVWTTGFDEDLYAPSKRGRAYRYSHLRVAQRVLLSSNERIGLLTNGVHLLILLSDPARPDSTISIPLDVWKLNRDVPDSFRLLLALACPEGVKAISDIVDKARLQQTRVTKELRVQARQAVERFVQEIIDHPENREWFESYPDREQLAKTLWKEGLIIIYRLLFMFKLEASDDPARSFSFASTSLWRNTFSPSMGLARYAPEVLETGAETGSLLETGLKNVFRLFEKGIDCTELVVKPLGGALFGEDAAPTLSGLKWGERSVAWLLDRLLWTPKRRGAESRERVHYGSLDVENLGRVYEALLELEPGITSESMCRLKRQKLEVVVPLTQGEKYHPDEEDESTNRNSGTRVEWVEEIPSNHFYLRVGLGRKASGSYYTPHSFVKFLVQETLGPQVAERSPDDDPKPLEILALKVLDPAMGSGHFLVEACRFLGDKLYESCRLCDEKALAAERKAEKAKRKEEREKLAKKAFEWRQRVIDLPDPDDELLKYLPSRSPEGGESGFSQGKAIVLCRRLIATHCLYGVDKNPLAVDLAKLSLWIESQAEGMPLTFLDHRLVVGDSLTGPFWDNLLFYPGNPNEAVDDLFTPGLYDKFVKALEEALEDVKGLGLSIGINLPDLERKKTLKKQLDQKLLPFRIVAVAWSGGVMLGSEQCDNHAYGELLKSIAEQGNLPDDIKSEKLRRMIAQGLGIEDIPSNRETILAIAGNGKVCPAFSYDLGFPEVFYPRGIPKGPRGFDAVIGNPPWEGIDTSTKEFYGNFDLTIFDAKTEEQLQDIISRLEQDSSIVDVKSKYYLSINSIKQFASAIFKNSCVGADGSSGATPDYYQLFAEKGVKLLNTNGYYGQVLPYGFHANEGSTGIRRLFLDKVHLMICFSYENRLRLFDIDTRFKFDILVGRRSSEGTTKFKCAFYRHREQWLYDQEGALEYSKDLVLATGKPYLNFIELSQPEDVSPATQAYKVSEASFGELCKSFDVNITEELHTSKDRWRSVDVGSELTEGLDPRSKNMHKELLEQGWIPLHEGKTFHQFNDLWSDRPYFMASLSKLTQDKRPKIERVKACRYYRLAFRKIARSNDERTSIFTILPPGFLANGSAAIEKSPEKRTLTSAILLGAVANAFPFDWLLRLKVAANVSFNFLDPTPAPNLGKRNRVFLVHGAIRLTANHSSYDSFWNSEMYDNWRELHSNCIDWPVIRTHDQRWELRTAMDAVVTVAYGMNRNQYEHILSTFSHTSYPTAPELCLSKFDELKQIGLEAFCKKYDPYWDIPLNENLPQPVIDLPIPGDGEESANGELALGMPSSKKKKARKRKK